MQEEQPRRKPRIPLSPEELYYFKKLKTLNELKRIEEFKKTTFYKILNSVNIVLVGFLSYFLMSILVFSHWEKFYISNVNCVYGEYSQAIESRQIIETQITISDGTIIPIRTSEFYQIPQVNDFFYVGKDYLFGKILKAKFTFDDRTFWHVYTYPTFSIILVALCIGFFVYKVNRHLTYNGLLTVFGLFILASLYFVLI